MGLIAKELGRACITGSSYATADQVVVNATTKNTIITKITLYNAHSSAVTVVLMRVLNNAGAVATPTVVDIFWSQSIAAGDTIILGHTDVSRPMLATNDTLQVYADVASKVNIFVDGFTMPEQS